MEKPIIMYDSQEAASWKTGLEGWVSSTGHFYGADEHQARFAGCTHKSCSQCGKSAEKFRILCSDCQDKKQYEKYLKYPIEKYNNNVVCLRNTEEYFFDEEELINHLINEVDVKDWEDLELLKCRPVYLNGVTIDYWDDVLLEDQELPTILQTKIAELNTLIGTLEPSCWYPDKIRIDISDLITRLKLQLSTALPGPDGHP